MRWWPSFATPNCHSPALPPAVAMKKNFLPLVFSLAVALLAGCQSAPTAVSRAPKAKVVTADHETLYSNISVSEAKGISEPFKTEKGAVFPENKMGYKLIL